MKSINVFCAIIVIVFGAQLLNASCTQKAQAINVEGEEYLEENHAISGMFFSTDYVVEEYEYDDAYCLLYDDPDANMFNVEICVDLETYQLVIDCIKKNRELIGTLVLNEDYSRDGIEVFTYMPEPEFEMADASANI